MSCTIIKDESETWTFYRISTIRGTVSVDFEKIKGADNEAR